MAKVYAVQFKRTNIIPRDHVGDERDEFGNIINANFITANIVAEDFEEMSSTVLASPEFIDFEPTGFNIVGNGNGRTNLFLIGNSIRNNPNNGGN